MGTSGWSTQQLAEFVAAVSTPESVASAAITAVERAAEALDADVAAIVCGGEVVAAVGVPDGTSPVDQLEAVKPGLEGSSHEVPGVGMCTLSAIPLEYPPGASLVIGRVTPHTPTREETGLLRAMALVASMTMRMLRVRDNERGAREELEGLAGDQAALRRVATLVAKAAPRADIYAAVAAEIAQRLGADVAAVLRYEADGSATIVGAWSVPGRKVPTGARLTVAGEGVAASVWRTHGPARVERFDGPPGSVAACFRSLGVHTGLGSPIVVEDDLWGVAFAAAARPELLPAGSDARIAEFTELVATAIANAEGRTELRRVADEQAALRRVATLVARGESQSAVFARVAEEVGRVLPGADVALVARYEAERAVEFVGGWTRDGDPSFVGQRVGLGGRNVSTSVFEHNAPASIDHLADDAPATAFARHWARSSAGAPINVEGRLWGVMIVGSSRQGGLAPEIEQRLAAFTELVATAIANAEAREELRRVADEQVALRRVATLVARSAPPAQVFATVAEELGRLLSVDRAGVCRYDGDCVTVVGGWSATDEALPLDSPFPLGGHNAVTRVFETGRPARIQYSAEDSYPSTIEVRETGGRAAAGAPIKVAGQLWGAAIVVTKREEGLPAHTETRLADFTDLIATAIANTHAREDLRQVADDQAALRRVATLVARGAPADEIFDAVTEEVQRLTQADETGLSRYDPDGLWTVLAVRGAMTDAMPIGFRLDPGPSMPGVAELLAGRSVRVDAAPVGTVVDDLIRGEQIQAWVASPIVIMGQTWGQVAVFSREGPLPAGTEERLADFTDIVATAIANTEARDELRRVADEQAALQRVATLVAAAAPPTEVFAAVAEEVGRLLSADRAYVSHYDTDDMVTVVGGWTPTGEQVPGLHQRLRGHVSMRVRETGRSQRASARVDGASPELGNRSAVAAPITVDGRLWGLMGVAWTNEEQPPPETEERLTKFTELVATALGNANARAELTASRARIVASADEARRKIERDLHDGAQQRLVTIALRLRAAQAALPPELREQAAELDGVVVGLDGVLEELRELARGIHPPILAEGGLGPALRMLARRSAVPVDLEMSTESRMPEPIEVAAYFVVSEALTNVAKHAHATTVTVELEVDGDALRVVVRDDGAGGAVFVRGSGLVGLKDRAEALGGRVTLESGIGAGTELSVELPLSPDAGEAVSR